jgi:O-antigen/teichoic acid export membrane protein
VSALGRNVLYNAFGQGIVVLLGLVAVKFTYGRLGQDAFGILYFNSVVTSLLINALEIGISSTTVREVASHRGDGSGYITELIRTASLFYWTAGLLVIAAIYVAAPLLVTHWVNLRALPASTAVTMLRVLSVTGMVALPKVLYISLCQGAERMALNNSIDMATSTIQQMGIVAVLWFGGGVIDVVAWITVTSVLGVFAYLLIAARLFGWRAILPGLSIAVVRRNLHFTRHMIAISVLAMIQTQSDKVVVGKLMPVGDLGLYSFAYSTAGKGSLVTNAIRMAAFPSLSGVFQRGNLEALGGQYRKLHDLISFGVVPVFAAIVFAALPIYEYLFGATAAHRLLLPTALLCVGFFMNAVLTMPYTVTLVVGLPQIAARLNLYALIGVLPVTAALIAWLGLVGAGLSWIFYHVVAYAYMVPRVCRECLGTSVCGWYTGSLKTGAAATFTYGGAWLLIAVPTGITVWGLALAYLVGTTSFAVASYLLIGPELKESVHGWPDRLAASARGLTRPVQ